MTEAEETRYRPDVALRYKGEGIVVVWEPALCIHAGNCLRRLPQTFDPGERPWVQVNAAPAEELIETILSCPSGALSFELEGDTLLPPDDAPTTIEPRPNGPLFIRGSVEVIDSHGNVVRRASRIALCRCGHSENKPYCDLSHRAVGFTA